MTTRTDSIFVVGVPDSDPAPRQQPTPQPVARNHMAAPQPLEAQPTHFPTTPSTAMTHVPQTLEARNRADLHLQTAQAVGAAQFALNTYNLSETSKALRQALELTDRLALAHRAAVQVATNASTADGWASYDLNAPSGESSDTATRHATAANASKPADEFANYDLNDL